MTEQYLPTGAKLAAYHVVLMALVETHPDKVALMRTLDRFERQSTDISLGESVADEHIEGVSGLIRKCRDLALP